MTTTERDDPGLIKAARAKLVRGLPLDWDEREALNLDLAQKGADNIIAEMDAFRKENRSVIRYTQGTANSVRLAIRLLMGSMYALSAAHADKRQKLEADVRRLWGRIIELEERAPVTVQGTFDASKEYHAGDVVALNGASFIARRDRPGPCPGDGWQLSAAQGKTGKPGDRGPRGPAGPKVEKFEVDDRGMLVLTNADGSTATLDLKSVLKRFR